MTWPQRWKRVSAESLAAKSKRVFRARGAQEVVTHLPPSHFFSPTFPSSLNDPPTCTSSPFSHSSSGVHPNSSFLSHSSNSSDSSCQHPRIMATETAGPPSPGGTYTHIPLTWPWRSQFRPHKHAELCQDPGTVPKSRIFPSFPKTGKRRRKQGEEEEEDGLQTC